MLNLLLINFILVVTPLVLVVLLSHVLNPIRNIVAAGNEPSF